MGLIALFLYSGEIHIVASGAARKRRAVNALYCFSVKVPITNGFSNGLLQRQGNNSGSTTMDYMW
ncbi:hypothetical protein HKD37_07G019023 [Glycine soja]